MLIPRSRAIQRSLAPLRRTEEISVRVCLILAAALVGGRASHPAPSPQPAPNSRARWSCRSLRRPRPSILPVNVAWQANSVSIAPTGKARRHERHRFAVLAKTRGLERLECHFPPYRSRPQLLRFRVSENARRAKVTFTVDGAQYSETVCTVQGNEITYENYWHENRSMIEKVGVLQYGVGPSRLAGLRQSLARYVGRRENWKFARVIALLFFPAVCSNTLNIMIRGMACVGELTWRKTSVRSSTVARSRKQKKSRVQRFFDGISVLNALVSFGVIVVTGAGFVVAWIFAFGDERIQEVVLDTITTSSAEELLQGIILDTVTTPDTDNRLRDSHVPIPVCRRQRSS